MNNLEQFSYLFLTLVFSLPVIIYIFANYRDLLRAYSRSILVCMLVSVGLFFVVDTTATYFYAWEYDYSKTLNIVIHERSVLEELIWTLPVSFVLSVAVALAHSRRKLV